MDNQKIDRLVRELRLELVSELPAGVPVNKLTPYQKKLFATAKLTRVIDSLNDNDSSSALEGISKVVELILDYSMVK